MADVTARRSAELDVVRAVALIGVCVMNYHGYINGAAMPNTTALERLFHPWTGPLATRFAATFVVVAGVGVELLARNRDVAETRWVLVRRGVLLLGFGYVLDASWPGTILFFYGGYFCVAALLVGLRTRWIMSVGAGAAVAAAGLQWWQLEHGGLEGVLGGAMTSGRAWDDVLADLTLRGTHPLLPWLAFLCAGIVIGRAWPLRTDRAVLVAFGGVLVALVGVGMGSVLPGDPWLWETVPASRSLAYTASAGGVAVTALVAIVALARRTATSRPTRALAIAGRTTLSLYVLHVIVFEIVVDTFGIVDRGAGLGAVLWFAGSFWLGAMGLAVAWSRLMPIGPLEWVYRRFSDTRPVAPR